MPRASTSSSDTSPSASPIDLINRTLNQTHQPAFTLQQSPLANDLSALNINQPSSAALSLGPPALSLDPRSHNRALSQPAYQSSQLFDLSSFPPGFLNAFQSIVASASNAAVNYGTQPVNPSTPLIDTVYNILNQINIVRPSFPNNDATINISQPQPINQPIAQPRNDVRSQYSLMVDESLSQSSPVKPFKKASKKRKSSKRSNKQFTKRSKRGRKKYETSESESSDEEDSSEDDSDESMDDEDASLNASISSVLYQPVVQATKIEAPLLSTSPAAAVVIDDTNEQSALELPTINQPLSASQAEFLVNFDPTLRDLLSRYACKSLKPIDSSNVWTCFLTHLRGSAGIPLCTKRYQKSSRRSFKKHLWKCLCEHFPMFAKHSLTNFRRLCSVDPVLASGFHVVTLFPRPQRERRPAEALTEAEKWHCPNGCGQIYRNTSSTSITRHTQKQCRFKNLTEEERERAKEEDRQLEASKLARYEAIHAEHASSDHSMEKRKKSSKHSSKQSQSLSTSEEPVLKRARTFSPAKTESTSAAAVAKIAQSSKRLTINCDDQAHNQVINPPTNQPLNHSNDFTYRSSEMFKARQNIQRTAYEMLVEAKHCSNQSNNQFITDQSYAALDRGLNTIKEQMAACVSALLIHQSISQDYQSIRSVLIDCLSAAPLPVDLQHQMIDEVTRKVLNNPINPWFRHGNTQTINPTMNQSNSQSISQSISQSLSNSYAPSPAHKYLSTTHSNNNQLVNLVDMSPRQLQARLFPQSINQVNQPIHQSINSILPASISQSINPVAPINQSAFQFFADSPGFATRILPITPLNQSFNQSHNQSHPQSNNQPINHFVFDEAEMFRDGFGRQYANLQSISQSNNHSISHKESEEEEKEQLHSVPEITVRRK